MAITKNRFLTGIIAAGVLTATSVTTGGIASYASETSTPYHPSTVSSTHCGFGGVQIAQVEARKAYIAMLEKDPTAPKELIEKLKHQIDTCDFG
ncbi:hypothetical protein IT072_03225 [Leifsonia sp. ZF2019]|uniref:hypothetical protein n=1 Tax=Leifsonia sp. ZF2019 TaxID=2781978 RepID=UPI001CC07472|nr:hypothetical protein [Leifsonia sp. ZF2019]UAJ80084.1 hypothetical protein IT072_03225 [Leifsonia sp. ZF2019]